MTSWRLTKRCTEGAFAFASRNGLLHDISCGDPASEPAALWATRIAWMRHMLHILGVFRLLSEKGTGAEARASEFVRETREGGSEVRGPDTRTWRLVIPSAQIERGRVTPPAFVLALYLSQEVGRELCPSLMVFPGPPGMRRHRSG